MRAGRVGVVGRVRGWVRVRGGGEEYHLVINKCNAAV